MIVPYHWVANKIPVYYCYLVGWEQRKRIDPVVGLHHRTLMHDEGVVVVVVPFAVVELDDDVVIDIVLLCIRSLVAVVEAVHWHSYISFEIVAAAAHYYYSWTWHSPNVVAVLVAAAVSDDWMDVAASTVLAAVVEPNCNRLVVHSGATGDAAAVVVVAEYKSVPESSFVAVVVRPLHRP